MNFFEDSNFTSNSENKLYTGVPISEAIKEMFGKQDILEKEPCEYILSAVPNPRELEQLTHLSVEVSITKLPDGRLVLSSGTGSKVSQPVVVLTSENSIKNEDLVSDRHDTSPLSFHTHPGDKPCIINWPSEGDIWALSESTNRTMLIGSPEYLMIFSISLHVSPNKVKRYLDAHTHKTVRGKRMDEEQLFKSFCDEFKDQVTIEYFPWDSDEVIYVIEEEFSRTETEL